MADKNRILQLRGIIEGVAEGFTLVYKNLVSFYGEVDPSTATLIPINKSITGRILVIRGTRGSTVGPYILFSLYKNNKAPAAIISEHIEPILVAGSVLGRIPLAQADNIDDIPDNCYAVLESTPPKAILKIIECK